MVLSLVLVLPIGWWTQGLGNHGLWISFLLFMALRAVTQGIIAWRLQQRDAWFD
jgi:MATE family multidrug resistance protein